MMRPHLVVGTVGLALFPMSDTATAIEYCDDHRATEVVEGQFDFRGSELKYRSQVEETNSAGKRRYRYCVENTHPFAPSVVLWHEFGDDLKAVFDGTVPQQNKRPQFTDSFKDFNITSMSFKYGGRRHDWEGEKDPETIYREASLGIMRAQFNGAEPNVPELLESPAKILQFLSGGATISLSSGSVVDIPTTKEAAEFLSGRAEQPIEPIEFIRIEVYFSSVVESAGDSEDAYRVSNRGLFVAQELDIFGVLPSVRFQMEDRTIKNLGNIEMLAEAPFEDGQREGIWMLSEWHADTALSEYHGKVEIAGPNGIPVAIFPISYLAPQ